MISQNLYIMQCFVSSKPESHWLQSQLRSSAKQALGLRLGFQKNAKHAISNRLWKVWFKGLSVMEKFVTEWETEPSFRAPVTNQEAHQLPSTSAIHHQPVPWDNTVLLTTVPACPSAIICPAQSLSLKSQGNNVAALLLLQCVRSKSVLH